MKLLKRTDASKPEVLEGPSLVLWPGSPPSRTQPACRLDNGARLQILNVVLLTALTARRIHWKIGKRVEGTPARSHAGCV